MDLVVHACPTIGGARSPSESSWLARRARATIRFRATMRIHSFYTSGGCPVLSSRLMARWPSRSTVLRADTVFSIGTFTY